MHGQKNIKSQISAMQKQQLPKFRYKSCVILLSDDHGVFMSEIKFRFS